MRGDTIKSLIIGLSLITTIQSNAQTNNVGIGTNTPDASAILDLESTNKGILIPRSDTNSITGPATGLLIYQTIDNNFYYFDGTFWQAIGSGNGSQGPIGPTGTAGVAGATGPSGAAGVAGATGPSGAAGVAGATGPSGAAGVAGAAGPSGAAGVAGATGPSGAAGVAGTTGPSGAAGPSGPIGPTGLDGALNAWSLTGNAGTTVGTNFIGTTDSQDWQIKTNNANRMRVMSDGRVVINSITPTALDLVSAYANAGDWALNGYSSGDGTGVFGENTGDGFGLFGNATGTDGIGSYAQASGTDGIGSYSIATGTGSVGSYGVATNTTSNAGVFYANNAANTFSSLFAQHDGGGSAISGHNTLGTGRGGTFISANDAGVLGISTNTTSNSGVNGLGNNGLTYYSPLDGAGVSGTGDNNGVAGYGLTPSDDTRGVLGSFEGGGNNDGMGVAGFSDANPNWGYGVWGQGNFYGVYANGDMGCAGAKTFIIDHPLDPENKFLKHFSMESPEILNVYRGNVTLDNSGSAEVQLPSYFHSININFSYQLTPIGGAAPNLHVLNSIDNNGIFKVSGGSPNLQVSWIVYAERNDLYVQKNPDKKIAELPKEGSRKGKYIMAELYGKSEDLNMVQPKKHIGNTVSKIEAPKLIIEKTLKIEK